MKLNGLIIFVVISVVACQKNKKLPDTLKKGLLHFEVHESKISEKLNDTSKNNTLDPNELWVGFNKINVKTSLDTLQVEVNVDLLKGAKYDGGIEYARDTLFLYAKRLDHNNLIDTVHSTLTYKIFTSGRLYKEIEFQEVE